MKILMVCLGNICRSPVAEGILKSKVDSLGLSVEVDSAGTSGWHDGAAPDKRSQANSKSHGLNISKQKSRRVVLQDFTDFDLIFAMDENNYQDLLSLAGKNEHPKIKMILNESFPNQNLSVPDPYYTEDGFEDVYKLLDHACDQIIANYLTAK